MSLSPKHAAIREGRIGSTDSAAILGLSPWRSAYDVWLRLTGRLQEGDITGDQLEIGRMMEAPLIDWAADIEKVKVLKNQLRVHAELPMSAQHDALIVGEPRGMEAKTSGGSDDWGEPGTDQVPDNYLVQAHHQMIVSGLREIVMPVALFGFSRKLHLYRIARNDSLCAAIIDRVQSFMALVKTDTPPADSVPSQDIMRRMRRIPGKRVRLPVEAVDAVKAYQVAQEAEKAFTAAARAAKKDREAAAAKLAAGLVDGEEGEIEVDGATMIWRCEKSQRKGYTVESSEVIKWKLEEAV